MKITARRCNANNICDTFANYTFADFCQRLENPKMLGYRYLSKIKPPLKCPVKAGTYNVDAVASFLGLILDLPIEGFRWIIRASMTGKAAGEKNGMTTIGCLSINARVMASTSRKRIMKASDVVKVLT